MDYNVSHFKSCYIEYNQGQTKWKIKTTPSPHFDDEKKVCFGFGGIYH